MTDLTLDVLIKYLGEPVRKRGAEYEWQCPYCQYRGEDNLKFNENKGILYCFANPEHSRAILKTISQNEGGLNFKVDYNKNFDFELELELNEFETQEKQKSDEERFLDFAFDMEAYNAELLRDKKALELLLQKRGITANTAEEIKIGINREANRWAIPTIQYETNIYEDSFLPRVIGFEYRPLDFSKKELTREKDCPTHLAQINKYTDKTQILTVIEGYFDGYLLYQYLKEKGIADLYHIVTPCNGVNSLIKQIDEVNFTKYKKFELFLDNDESGQRVADKILEKYPFFTKIELNCGCKDFNEHYLKCIKKIHES